LSAEPRRRHVHPPVWLLLHGLLQLGLHRWLPGPRVVPPEWRDLGLLPGFAGVALVFWCVTLFVRRGTPIRPFTESTALVRAGPYRLSRNPIYLGLTLLLASSAAFFGTATPWLAVASFVLVIRQRFVLREEALLRARFGAEYQGFCRDVRRWL
jgi:protein-S-isoprenylcysteine O-methyltransferase Ste14